ncbi:cystathionine beta-lyase [Tenacibaculum discolor]|uniref:Aminotransferase class I/II-fold pyridoxal phosphate-dependent enzyme n=1 Tax=Tenacibaculum discolor TaxID=361581 RepID=A0A2G1BYT1_9FLAO|nr:aminotransferase class I/II-fold pyridoxal phosphate-dependent enzyme [Tenacibaculum discolor]MDP2541352.1 aminotransferase class I/II-fold pyridoxal phosphate-dependent enzyme [Tenacibaculum discolor]PHN99190.1 cystathionine beta-lyase [Tenacibaculum discolor]PHO01045.1 cystathionine beta-lyase [Rhodobacteraceae bacterium 4F10]
MNTKPKLGINTICTHVGEIKDEQFKGAISPIYMSTSYQFDNVDVKRYPRYFNTPNQEALSKKIAALEKTEAGLLFGSGMAAISTSLLAFLQKGDHVVLQETLYGGTYNFVVEEFDKFGIEYSFTNSLAIEDFEKEIQHNTRVIFIETPSNPLLKVVDIQAVANLAKEHGIVTMIDNTFASPINQTPVDFGIDIMIHSATKYMGGHSDILAGAVAASEEYIQRIWNLAKNLGGSLSDFTVWMLERSLKTMNLRVKRQSKNALKMAKYLEKHEHITKVYYPGLKSHTDYELAKSQMKYFGGMLSFELQEEINAMDFQRNLALIKPSMSLAGVESTMLSPTQTSHALLSPEERAKQGIKDGLIRFSIGIEETKDLIKDIEQAIQKTIE